MFCSVFLVVGTAFGLIYLVGVYSTLYCFFCVSVEGLDRDVINYY